MTASTGVTPKTLFVGDAWICRQVAYVLDVQDYGLVEKLTTENYAQYRDCQIYVCEFKRKSGKLVEQKLLKTKPAIQYLDDICRTIDKEHADNRRRHEREAGYTKPVKFKHFYQRGPIYALLRKMWHVYLRMIITNAAKRGQYKNQHKRYLRHLKSSELFLYVLYAKPNPNIQCTLLEKTEMRVEKFGDIMGCCSVLVPFGNLLCDGALDEIYHSTYARIIKLSSLNRSYCLCNLCAYCLQYCSDGKVLPTKQFTTPNVPQSIWLDYDSTCNLCCKSCRNQHYVVDDEESRYITIITDKLLRSGYLAQTPDLVVAGMGEVFYSPVYRQLLNTDLQRKNIAVLSNGTLFNEDNWRWLKGKYETIDVTISVDAATAETYRKLRGADFNVLMQNLKMLAELHRQKQIRNFNLHFVVQRDNFREMPAFVELGRTLGVDQIIFLRMVNFGNQTKKELAEQCLIIDDTYLDRELWDVLQDPVFSDPIVNLRGLQRYIDASAARYR